MQKKNLYITTTGKGGVGKSTISQNITAPILYRQADDETKEKLEFNIVEIDDNGTQNIWKSEKIRYKKFDISEYKEAIVQIQRTYADSNTVEILDLGAGHENTFQLLQHIAKMRLDEIFNLHFLVPTNRNTSIFDATKTTLQLIYSLFNNSQSTLVYNKVINNVQEEFQAFFGNPKFKIKSRFSEIEKYVKDEWVVYDDIHSLMDNSINETKQSTLDFYINAEYIVDNWINYRLEALNSGDANAIDEAMRVYDISYDFIEFFNKIKFEVER